MTITRKTYAGAAVEANLTAGINATATSLTIDDATGWPATTNGPFWIVVSPGLPVEEKMKVTARAGTVLTVPLANRGGDGTTAASHDANAVVRHVVVAEDIRELNEHAADIEADPHSTKLLNNARHDLTARHTPGTVLPVAAPAATSLPSDTAAEGVAASVARSDHRHPREGFGLPVASAVGDAQAAGTATTVARSDHKHAREGFGAVTAQTSFGLAANNGAATTLARSDHTHGTPASPSVSLDWGEVGDISSSAPGDTASAGTLDEVARADHRHAREAADATPRSCRVFHNAAQSVNNTTDKALAFNSERYDTGGMHSTSSQTERITFPAGGKWRIGCSIAFDPDANGVRIVSIRSGGVTTIASETNSSAGGSISSRICISTEYVFNAGDYVEVVVYQTSGGTIDVPLSTGYEAEFWASEII